MKWNDKNIYYIVKDNFELSERHMAYWYGLGGFVLASIIWWIV
jgi:hypothetical protein